MLLIKTYQMINHHKDRLTHLNQLTINSSRNILQRHHRTMLNLSGLLLVNPKIILSNKHKDLKNLSNNLQNNSRKYFINKSGYIGHFQSIIKMMSPENILNKGFAIVKVDGQIRSNADHIHPGTELTIQMAAAEIRTTVIAKSANHGNEINL